MKKVDMHIHTNVSDGTWGVEQLKAELKKNNIEIFSITDHDDIGNVENMAKIITPIDNLVYIKGVEATASYKGREYHLTLYNYDINNKRLIEFLNWTKNLRLDFNDRFIKYLSAFREDVTFDDFLEYKENRSKGGWKSLNYLIDKKVHQDMFEHFYDIGKSGLSITFKNPEKVVDICKQSGGYLFLAHPSYHYRNEGMSEEELKYWLSLGIDGVECYSPYNTGNDTGKYINFCNKNNLMISAGSDCHGDFIKDRVLGKPKVDLADLNIKKLLK